MPRIESEKANKMQEKLLRKQYVSKQSTESYEYKIAKISSLSMSWKLNTSLTQKDTMDRGAWMKNSERKACRRTHKKKGGDKKVQKHNSAKWHGNEEQMNIPVYYMLQSCGVQAGSYPKIEVKNQTHTSSLERVILTLKPWFPFSWTGLPSMIQSSCIYHLGNPYV